MRVFLAHSLCAGKPMIPWHVDAIWCTVSYTIRYGLYGIDYTVYSIPYSLYGIDYTVWSSEMCAVEGKDHDNLCFRFASSL